MASELLTLWLLIRRPGHTGKYHAAVRRGGGPRLTAEACNVDTAHVAEEGLGLPPAEAPRTRVCLRCYPDWPVAR